MFHSGEVNSKINHFHGRTLRIMYKGNISSCEELRKKDKSFCIRHGSIQSLTVELFKCDIFETRNRNYNLRSQTDFIRTFVSTSSFGLNSLKYLATKLWGIAPYDIKSV